MKKFSLKSNDAKTKKKKVLGILAALALILSLAGTYAWNAYTDWVKNHMQSLGFDSGKVTIIEEFDPDKPIEPGGTIKKKVDVINSTPVASFVRVSFEEQLSMLKENATEAKGFKEYARDKTGFPVISDTKSYYLAGSGDAWKDETAKLTADFTLPTGTDTLKLFVNAKEMSLINETVVTYKDFPANFNFTDTKFKLPIRVAKGTSEADYNTEAAKALATLQKEQKEKSTTPTEINVTQKVSGHIVRNVDKDTYAISQAYNDKDKDTLFWGYTTEIGKLEEADWAGGTPVWVNATADPATKPIFTPKTVASKIDSVNGPVINFADNNIIVGSGKNHDFATNPGSFKNKWFYNTDDGYFYYLSPLNSGTQTSASVMESITMPKNERYNLAGYDLHVGSEAIPASRAFLTTASKDGLVYDPTNPADKQAKIDQYNKELKITETNGAGFGLKVDEDKALYDFLAGQATIEDDK